MSSGKALALKRINKDMKEITKYPVEGVGIVSMDNDPMKYIVNIKLMTGLYQGYCIQLLLTFTDTFPAKPPKILILYLYVYTPLPSFDFSPASSKSSIICISEQGTFISKLNSLLLFC